MKRLIVLAMVVGLLVLGGCGYEPRGDIVARLVHKDGERLIPIETISFSVSIRTQGVIYFIRGVDTKERSELFKLKECKVLDEENWDGITDNGYKFEVINGKFKPQKTDNENNFFVGWWTWYFKTDPPIVSTHPSSFLLFLWNSVIGWGLGVFIFCAILISFYLKNIIEDGVSGIKDTLDRIDDHITEKE
jgi:hypothetical protein